MCAGSAPLPATCFDSVSAPACFVLVNAASVRVSAAMEPLAMLPSARWLSSAGVSALASVSPLARCLPSFAPSSSLAPFALPSVSPSARWPSVSALAPSASPTASPPASVCTTTDGLKPPASASSSSTVKRVFSGRSASVRDCPSARLTCEDPCASSVRSPLSAPFAPCKATAPESGEPASSASVMRKANSRVRSAAVICEDAPPDASVFDTASEPVFCAGASVSTPLLPRRAVSSVRSAAWYSETEMVFT